MPGCRQSHRVAWHFGARVVCAVGILSICLLVCIESLNRGVFLDEGEKIAAARFVAEGDSLYGTIFSHHFPLPYYYLAFVFRVFGPSVEAARISILALGLACVAIAALAWRSLRVLAVVAILWAVVCPFQLGQMALYDNIAGPALFLVFMLVSRDLLHIAPASPRAALVAGIAAGVAILSDPLLVYPVTVAILLLASTPPYRSSLAYIIGSLAAVLLLAFLLLVAGGIWEAFYRQAIEFNRDTYARFRKLGPVPIGRIGHEFITLLGIGNVDRVETAWIIPPFEPTTGGRWLEGWIFGGFFFRLAMLVAAGHAALRGRWQAALFIVGTAACLIGTGHGRVFHATPLVLCSLGAVAISITIAADALPNSMRWWTSAGATAVIVTLALGLTAHGGLARFNEWREGRAKGMLEAFAANSLSLADIARKERVPRLGIYPAGPYQNFFSGLRAPAGYLFVLPWNVDTALPRITRALEDEGAIVQYVTEGEVWGIPVKQYTQPLVEWIERRCPPIDGQLRICRPDAGVG